MCVCVRVSFLLHPACSSARQLTSSPQQTLLPLTVQTLSRTERAKGQMLFVLLVLHSAGY